MLLSTLLLFCISSIALAVTPGPTMLLALSNGISSGTRVAAFGIAGATVASACLIAAVAVGLGSLLLASET
uniref:LysE family transporter n=1 Tax=Undibacterium sp. TaxID=1914977 RepID=UPI00374D78BB